MGVNRISRRLLRGVYAAGALRRRWWGGNGWSGCFYLDKSGLNLHINGSNGSTPPTVARLAVNCVADLLALHRALLMLM